MMPRQRVLCDLLVILECLYQSINQSLTLDWCIIIIRNSCCMENVKTQWAALIHGLTHSMSNVDFRWNLGSVFNVDFRK